jgi:hypothetical protein
VSLAGNYTLVMVDAGVVGTNESAGQNRHWLINDVKLKQNGASSVLHRLRAGKSTSERRCYISRFFLAEFLDQ